MRKLALDLGTKTCGFAISDELGILATGIDNFSYENNNFNDVLNRIKYWQEYYQNKIDEIIIGLPVNATDGSSNARTELVYAFKKFLEDNWTNHLPIVLFDERFTTKIAVSYLKNDAKLKNSQIKKVKDKMSAVVILNDYLTTIKNHSF